MARYRDGLRVATNLFEAAAWHNGIAATCSKCGHRVIISSHALWWQFERKGWSHSLRDVPERLRCLRCGQGSPRIELVRDQGLPGRLPMPPEREWKRAISRFRS